MDTATAIAIAAPNVVAATAIVVGWLQHGKGLDRQRELADASFDHQRRLTDLDHVRVVLDDAAVTLHRVAYVLDDVRLGLAKFGAGLLEEPTGATAYEDLTTVGKDLDALIERLAVRLGREHDVVVAFTAASKATLDTFRTIDLLKIAPAKDDPDERLQRHRLEMGNTARVEVTQYRGTFDTSREEFTAAAMRVAGAGLPTSDKGATTGT